MTDFELTVSFERDVPVADLEIWYCEKNGNSFLDITYLVDTLNRAITLFGTNEYILHVTFPTLIFRYSTKNGEEVVNFYLQSTGALTSYTGEQKAKLRFDRDCFAMVVDLAKVNGLATHETLKATCVGQYGGDEVLISLGKRMTKVTRGLMLDQFKRL